MARAQGWYRDPYGIHDDRYFSAGQPTKLVRDGGNECFDPPPEGPAPDVLVPVEPAGPEADASDLRRADDLAEQPPYSTRRAVQTVLNIFEARGTV